jgi:hypothetical protein
MSAIRESESLSRDTANDVQTPLKLCQPAALIRLIAALMAALIAALGALHFPYQRCPRISLYLDLFNCFWHKEL